MARKKAETTPKAEPGAQTYAIGDHVRLPVGVENEVVNYRLSSRQEGRANPIQGLLLSIRDIKTGQLVAVAAGDPGQYVFEVLQDRSFQAGFASDHNVAKGAVRVSDNPVWNRLRSAMRQKTSRGELGSQATGLMNQSPINTTLDGWRMVKVRSRAIENVETAGDTALPETGSENTVVL